MDLSPVHKKLVKNINGEPEVITERMDFYNNLDLQSFKTYIDRSDKCFVLLNNGIDYKRSGLINYKNNVVLDIAPFKKLMKETDKTEEDEKV